MSSLVHLPCRKGPTEGPLRQWSPGLPVERECRDWPVPCSGGGTGRWAASQASPLQLMTLFGLSWGADGIFPLSSP